MFGGCIEVVRRTRGYRRWPEALKARIAAESFQPGARVVDVARRHELAPHQLSTVRRQARQELLALPAEGHEGLAGDAVPAFVPVSVESDAGAPSGGVDGAEGVVGIEIGDELVLRVPGDVSAERVAALCARCARGGMIVAGQFSSVAIARRLVAPRVRMSSTTARRSSACRSAFRAIACLSGFEVQRLRELRPICKIPAFDVGEPCNDLGATRRNDHLGGPGAGLARP